MYRVSIEVVLNAPVAISRHSFVTLSKVARVVFAAELYTGAL